MKIRFSKKSLQYKSIYVIIITTVFLLNSCKIEDETPQASIATSTLLKFVKAHQNNYKPDQLNAILAIPNAGCGGCVISTQDFVVNKLLEKKDQSSFIVIFTNIQDYKKFRKLELPEGLYDHPNIIIDRTNTLVKSGFSSFYPEAFFFKKGKLQRREFIKPDNSGVFLILESLF